MNGLPLLLGAGWKMNKTVEEAAEYTRTLLRIMDGIHGLERMQIFLTPPFTALAAVKRLSQGRFWVGAQNMHWEEAGAYTGEISARMLLEAGADLVELGHAERRRLFNETDETVARKMETATRHGLRPLLCVGDDRAQQESGRAETTVQRQLQTCLRDIPTEAAARLLVAYEPAWAIGEGGRAAEATGVRAMHRHIRTVLSDKFGPTARSIPVLYGGSVTAENAASFLTQGEADGLFVGRAAWTVESFAELIRAAAAALESC
jgi:triosephosphate isomerase